ncbi:DUF4097 family beta strand repeat-containing protein [Paenibacillus tyrfis]|uniref:Adhesin domain-containing protein n=1 Tax=Paenibacillus tyrfis TaxID=1501230 RepID=A0A081PA47_9BACL|nr:hypothetical protein [Paenibacillus tyrfis]KEQ27570.1 hypothetical protein ET33_12775 [Paenibacillus tyrfis]
MALRTPKSLSTFPKGAIRNAQINQRFPAEGIREFRIDVHTLGNLLICFDAEDEISVVAAGESHLLPQRLFCSGGALRYEGSNFVSYLKNGQKQKILIEAHVPPETKVLAKFTAGVVILDGGRGDIDIRGTFGEVSGITHSSKMRIKLHTGDVSLNELQGEADIRLNVGSATLGWTELEGPNRIHVHCGFGGVDLLLPAVEFVAHDEGVLPRTKRITTSSGSEITAVAGLGSIDVKHW